MTLIERIEERLRRQEMNFGEASLAALLMEALAELNRLQSAPCPHCGEKCDLRTEAVK